MNREEIRDRMNEIKLIVEKINDLYKCEIETGWKIEADAYNPDTTWCGGDEEELDLNEFAAIWGEYNNWPSYHPAAMYGIDEWTVPTNLDLDLIFEKNPDLYPVALSFEEYFEYVSGYDLINETPEDDDWYNVIIAAGTDREDSNFLKIEKATNAYLQNKPLKVSDLWNWGRRK